MKRILTFVYFFICASLLFSVTALAYIDPSAMTYIIQLIAGVAIAGGAAFGFYFRKVKRKLSGLRKGEAVQYYDEKDDDDKVGLDDYGIEQSTLPPTTNEPTASSNRPKKQKRSATAKSPALDPYDETGGDA